ELFLVVDGEREEVLPFLHGARGSDRAEHHGFAISGEDRAVSLTGNAAGFQSEGLSAPLQRYGFRVEHVFSFVNPRRRIARRGLKPGMPSRSGAGAFSRPQAPTPTCDGCQNAGRRLSMGAGFRHTLR